MWRKHLFLLSLLSCWLWCCVHSQDLGPDDCTANVSLSMGGTIEIPPGTVCVECIMNGELDTDAQFQLQGSNIDPSKGRTVDGILVLFETENVFVPNVNPNLRCFSSSGSIQALVIFVIFRPPNITGETTVNEGDDLDLVCDASNSGPLPSVRWLNPQGVEASNSRDLDILDIQRDGTGVYTCIATSQDGETLNSTANVIVQFAPDVTADSEDLVLVPLGSELQISCSFEGIPPPDTVTWRHNGSVLLTSDPLISIENSTTSTSLTRMNISEDGGGLYGCEASNEVGSNDANTTVRVQLPPGPPTNLQVTGQTTTTLSISWTNPTFNGFSDIASFRVLATGRGNNFSDTFNGDEDTTTFTLTGLLPFTNYTVRLFVRNAVELEGQPDETTGMTDSMRLPAVQNLSATNVSSTEISVSWQEPSFNVNTTAPVDEYQLMFRTEKDTVVETGDRTLNSTTTELSLTGLKMGAVYTITVVAINTAGPGVSGQVVQATNIDPPSMPGNFTGNSRNPFTIIASWTEPQTDGGRPLNGYHISITGGISPVMGGPLDKDTFSFLFEGLEQNTTYQLSITAFNIDDMDDDRERESAPAMVEVTTDPVGPPQVPATPTVSGITNTSATVSWTHPDGFPTMYRLQVKRRLEDWGDDSVMMFNVTETLTTQPGELRSQVVSNLEPLASYDARVLSVNLNGPSDFSTPAMFSTFSNVEIDGPLQNMTVESGTTVRLTCTQESKETTDITYTWSRVGGIPLPDGAQVNNGVLEIVAADEGDSGVYICTANGVSATHRVTIEDPSDDSEGVNTLVIIVVSVAGVIALILFVGAIVLAIICLCMGGGESSGKSSHIRRYSFRPRHWADASASHSMPRDQPKKEITNSFHMPDDYTGHTSFNTDDPTPHAGAEPTTSFQLSSSSDTQL